MESSAGAAPQIQDQQLLPSPSNMAALEQLTTFGNTDHEMDVSDNGTDAEAVANIPPFLLCFSNRYYPVFSTIPDEQLRLASSLDLIPGNLALEGSLLSERGAEYSCQPINRFLEELEGLLSIENDVSLVFPALSPLVFNINNSFCEDLTLSDVYFAHTGAVGPSVPVVATLTVESYHFANVWNSFVQRAEKAEPVAQSVPSPDAIPIAQFPTQTQDNDAVDALTSAAAVEEPVVDSIASVEVELPQITPLEAPSSTDVARPADGKRNINEEPARVVLESTLLEQADNMDQVTPVDDAPQQDESPCDDALNAEETPQLEQFEPPADSVPAANEEVAAETSAALVSDVAVPEQDVVAESSNELIEALASDVPVGDVYDVPDDLSELEEDGVVPDAQAQSSVLGVEETEAVPDDILDEIDDNTVVNTKKRPRTGEPADDIIDSSGLPDIMMDESESKRPKLDVASAGEAPSV